MPIQAKLKAEIPQVEPFIGLEMYHTAKIQQVGNDKMAFACRGPQSNFIISVHWSKEDVDKVDVDEIRKMVTDIVAATKEPVGKQSYGNYGALVLLTRAKIQMVTRSTATSR